MINRFAKIKTKISIILALSVLTSLTVGANNVYAEDEPIEQSGIFGVDESLKDLPGIPVMDEEGNITYINEEESPSVESVSLFTRLRSGNDKVVNFRCNSEGKEIPVGTTTEFTVPGVGGSGYTYGRYGADAAYLGMKDGKVKFMLNGVIGLVDKSAVQVVNVANTNISHYEVKNGKLIHYISTNLNSDRGSRLVMGDAASYMSEGAKYYSYDGNYFYKDYSTMVRDYENDRRSNSINPNKPYYNYFQFLPLRSKTNYSENELNELINANKNVGSDSKLYNLGKDIVQMQNRYGVNALLIASVAANESAWGTSNIAKSKNNLFGLNAFDSDTSQANSFRSPQHCVEEFAEIWMSKQYLSPANWKYAGAFLGNKGSGINVRYASDPYWGEKAANVAYTLDSQRRDVGSYTIGIKDTINTKHTVWNVRAGSSTSSGTKVYKTEKFSNMAFIILGEENDFYKIQSEPVLNSDRKSMNKSTGEYNFENMYLYISKGALTKTTTEVAPEPQPEPGATVVTSPIYSINESQKIISGITELPTDKEKFQSKLSVDGGSVKITTADGQAKTGDMGTGDLVQVLDRSGKVINTYTVVIYGDTNGDGILDIFDLSQIQRDIIQVSPISGIKRTAGDTNRDGEIDIFDLSQVQRDIIGVAKVKQ